MEAEAKKKQGESSAQVEEVTDEEAERIMKEEAAKKAKLANEDSTPAEKAEEGEEKKEGEEVSDKQAPLPGNGGFTDKYKWAQTLEELTVYIALPDLTAAKQLDVKIQSKKLVVAIKGQPDKIIDGELNKKVKTDDSFWSVESDGSRRTLQLNL